MTELLTAAQMRAIEQAAIDSGEVTGLELMERAGRGVVEAIFEEWPELAKSSYRAVVLCGPGNNGGDGFVVARLLKDWGWEVEVFLYGDREKLPPDAKVNCERWLEMGEIGVRGSVLVSKGVSLVIDAVFGTGLSRPLGLEYREISEFIADASIEEAAIIVAVDLPSGLCSESGKILVDPMHVNVNVCKFHADLTVTFHSLKVGHIIGNAHFHCGYIKVKSIGLQTNTVWDLDEYWPPFIVMDVANGPYYSPLNIAPKFGQLAKRVNEHKYESGHAFIISGPAGKTGAARLAARGALRIGAGLVTIGSPTAAMHEHAAQLNAIMVRPVDGAKGLVEVLEDARISSICLGPGLGLNETTKEMVEVALKSGCKLVLDADALSVYQNNEEDLFALCHDEVVLTPHGGEFARLFPDIAAKLNAPAIKGPAYSKVDATREAAKRAGCVVLFKGADTVIAHPDGRCSINSALYERTAPWLATAGSGDVLAGFITGLLARGFAPMTAAETGAWLHVECARSFGPGLIAEDLPEELPKVFRGLDLT